MSELQPGTFQDGFENSMFTGEYLSSTDLIEGDPAEGVGVAAGFGKGASMGGVVDVI